MIILGLGSNVGDRMAYLDAAVRKLSLILEDIHCSRILESAAMLPPDATPDMNRPFLNMAVSGNTPLSAETLLAGIKNIERELGRVERCKWGPREIDIDILAMDDVQLQTPALTVPHPEMLNRDFVLLPLGDVAPGWKYPVSGHYHHKTAKEIIREKSYALNESLRETGLSLHG